MMKSDSEPALTNRQVKGRDREPCVFEQEPRIHRKDDPERAGAGVDMELSGGQKVREAARGAQDMAVACRRTDSTEGDGERT